MPVFAVRVGLNVEAACARKDATHVRETVPAFGLNDRDSQSLVFRHRHVNPIREGM